jgi:hypothetical protein
MGTKLTSKEIDQHLSKEEINRIKAVNAKKEKMAKEGKIIRK